MKTDPLSERKTKLVKAFYVQPADRDYLLADHTYGFDPQVFFWKAAQAFEKYTKACLVANGIPAIGQGHDLLKLYHQVADGPAKGLVPNLDAFPNITAVQDPIFGRWHNAYPWIEFFERIIEFGSPSNRYGLYGGQIYRFDIDYLHYTMFKFRRVCVPLDETIGRTPYTWRETLMRYPLWMPNSDDLSIVSRWLRESGGYMAHDEIDGARRIGGRQSMIHHYVNMALKYGPDEDASMAPMLLRWITENVQMTKEDKRRLGFA